MKPGSVLVSVTAFALFVAYADDQNSLEVKPPATPGPSALFEPQGDVRHFLRRVDSATRNVLTAQYSAAVARDGASSGELLVTVKRDASAPRPYSGKIFIQLAGSPKVFAFDGRYFRTRNMPTLGTAATQTFVDGLREAWIHFLHPTPFQDAVDAAIARFEGEREVDDHTCTVVYVQYQDGTRSRWFFDQTQGLPRRVERLSEKEGKESVLAVTMTGLRVNNRIADETFAVGKRTPEFSEEDAQHLFRIYVLTSPIAEGDYRSYIAKHRSFFTENGGSVRLARSLGLALIAAGVASYDPTADQRIKEAALRSGAPLELTPEVAASYNKSALDLWQLGNELLWLAEVLPAAANGDFEPYETTGTWLRLMARMVLPSIEDLIRHDPGMVAIWEHAKKQFGLLSEAYLWTIYRYYAACFLQE